MSNGTMMTRQTSKAVEENPFYKMTAALDLFQQGNKLPDDSVTQQQVYSYLSAAWKECNTKERKELFFVLLFSLGDISNREHNVFRRKGIKQPDQGGQSKRRVFMFCLNWMLTTVPRQFYTFLPIIGEYYNLGGLMFYQLKTDRWKGTLKETLHLPVDVDEVTTHIAQVLRSSVTTDNDRTLWAKWLPHVPSTSRIRKYTITDKNIKTFKKNEKHADVKLGDVVTEKKQKKVHTKAKDAWVIGFITTLSKKMDWDITKGGTHFDGYRKFRKTYLSDTEAAKFSAHPDDPRSVVNFDKTQFLEWLDKQPSGARYRVACRIVNKDKAGKLSPRNKWILKSGENCGQLYMDWLNIKEKAQTKLASLSVEDKEKLNPVELKQMQKAAKVNVAGDTLIDLLADFASRRLNVQEMDTKAFSLLEKISIGLPVLIIADISGSMSTNSVYHKQVEFMASAMSQIATTLFLLKNPDEELQQMFIRFDTSAEVITTGQLAEKQGSNRFMGTEQSTVKTLVDKTKPFSWNLANVSQYIISRGGTSLDCVSKELYRWVNAEPAFKSQRIEMINKYPVVLLVSDGDLNSHGTALMSLQSFQREMKQYFGWEGVVVLWDVKQQRQDDGKKFETAENLMYFGGTNPAIVDQLFRNIHDLDIIDPYLPLKALHSSNRYQPVKDLVL